MSKKILILEPSATMQSLFTEKTKKAGFDLSFEVNGIKFLLTALGNAPDAVFINAKAQNPKSIELVRLIKSVDKLKKVPVGMYATGDFSFEKFYMQNSGADLFVHINEKDIPQQLQSLLDEAAKETLAVPVQNDIMKNALIQGIFDLNRYLDSVEKIAEGFLNIITEFCEVPAAALLLLENDGPAEYYLTASNFTEAETRDFLKVCTTDFGQINSDINISQIAPHQVNAEHALEKFHSADIPLSSYQNISLIDSSMLIFGTINVVKEGNFSTRQLDLLHFCAQNGAVVLENAIMLKKKNFFEQRIRTAFSRFVPEQIIDELVTSVDTTNKAASVGEKREVAILFSDIRSFTSISERNKPETLVAFLNRYFTIMVNTIKKHGGTIDKFVGDAIMAEFGVPVSYEDNARRAVAAAYEMREVLPTVPLEDLVLPPGMTFNIGIGIHYGDVTVGSIGSSDKTDYTVIGDSVNLASRLEGLTKAYGTMILVSESVKADIKDDDAFVFRHLDDVKVKGKERAVPIYAVDRSQEEFSPEYRDCYAKGLDLYQQGVWNLAKEYFEKAHAQLPSDKASALMLERCEEFIRNPPENWDGAITFHTK